MDWIAMNFQIMQIRDMARQVSGVHYTRQTFLKSTNQGLRELTSFNYTQLISGLE